jgi:hypothetical protein
LGNLAYQTLEGRLAVRPWADEQLGGLLVPGTR